MVVNYRYRKFEDFYTLSGNTLYVVFSGSVRDVIILSVLSRYVGIVDLNNQ